MDLYGNWGMGLDSAVNYIDKVWKQFFAKWRYVIKGPRFQMSHHGAARYAIVHSYI